MEQTVTVNFSQELYTFAIISPNADLFENNPRATGFGANSNQGQIVTNIGYYLGLLVTNSNDILIILPRPN